MMELKTHIEYLEHQEAPPVVVEGDSGEALALTQKLERCFDRVAAAENSIDTTNEALGIAQGAARRGAAAICGTGGPISSVR